MRAPSAKPRSWGFLDWVAEHAADASSVPRVAPAPDRVNVLTWHASKGLEWLVVVLYDLHHVSSGSPCGVAVDAPAEVNASEPLRGRTLRFWPQAVSDRQTSGPFATAMGVSDAGRLATQLRAEEELRLLYVAWTRPRDRLVLAARPDRLGEGALAALRAKGVPMVREPMVRATWGRKVFDVVVRDGAPSAQPAPPSERSLRPPTVPRRARIAAKVLPSALVGRVPVLASVSLAAMLSSALGDPTMLGQAIHALFVADDVALPRAERENLARRILARFAGASVAPAELVRAHDALVEFLQSGFPGAKLLRAVPIDRPLADGARVVGEADLVVLGSSGSAVVDHKVALLPATGLS